MEDVCSPAIIYGETSWKTKGGIFISVSGRQAALEALITYRQGGTRSDILLNDIIQRNNLDEREASLFYTIVMGVLRNTALCDYYIEQYLSSDIKKLQPIVLDILRLSVYQIVFMTRIPNRAAVNEGVEMAKKRANRSAAGLVNAVLRRIAENAQKLPPIKARDRAQYLSIKYSHPRQLVEYLVSRLGIDGAEEFLKSDNEIAPISIRVNKLKTTAPQLEQLLTQAGIDFMSHQWAEGFYFIQGQGSPDRMQLYREGMFTVQDPASALAVMTAGLEKNTMVLDCCAAPGGKSFMAAQLMENSGSILSCDLHEKKLKHIRQGAQRLGIDIISCRAMDAAVHDGDLSGKFDIVLCDAPCSGFGVIAKKPEIRYKTFESISQLPEIQLSILRNVSKYLKKGGTLLYSTCTIMENENEDVVRAFLDEDHGFAAEPFELPFIGGDGGKGHMTLWPHLHGTDGFFIAKMKKVE